ncbi:hypothetical protein OF83DRAFT_1132073 [Amylostereum chailletii]|nr:hypothetical protein OF83DRAFT_1132073 [Amylostereum chailletii]
MMTSDAALFNSGCISPPSFPPRCLVPHVSRDMPTGPRLERDRSSPAITLVMRVRYTGVKATQLAKVSSVDVWKIADHIYADLKGLGIPQPQKTNMYKLMNEEDTVYMYWDTVEGSNILTELTRKVGEAGGNDLKATQLTSVMVYKLGPRTSEASPPATVDPRKRETRSSTMTSSPGDALLHDQQTTSPPDIRSATQSLSKSAVVERSQASAPPVSSKMVLHTAFPSLKKAAAIEPHNRGIARPAITMQIKYCSEVASLTGSQPEPGASSPSPSPSLLSQPPPFPPLQSEISERVEERFITFEPKERGDMVRCDEGEDMEVAEGQGQAEGEFYDVCNGYVLFSSERLRLGPHERVCRFARRRRAG